jgi:amino acid transporter
MPVSVDQAVIPSRPQQLSARAMVLCCACFLATFFGASAVTLSLSLVLQAHADSSAYWTMSVMLLIIWFVTLVNMHRVALATVLAER